MTNYTPTNVLNFINELLRHDTNLVSVTMNIPNEPLQTEAGSTALFGHYIKIQFKDITKSDCRFVYDSLKDYLKDNDQSFNLILGSGVLC